MQLKRTDLPPPFRRAQRVTAELQTAYANEFWNISESTIVVHQIAPLLRDLKFATSQIRLEWNRIDIAVVEEDNWGVPILIVEAKAPSKGLRAAREQGKNYGRSLDEPPLLVTNGFTLELYRRGGYEAEPLRAYLPAPRASAIKLFDELQRLARP